MILWVKKSDRTQRGKLASTTPCLGLGWDDLDQRGQEEQGWLGLLLFLLLRGQLGLPPSTALSRLQKFSVGSSELHETEVGAASPLGAKPPGPAGPLLGAAG